MADRFLGKKKKWVFNLEVKFVGIVNEISPSFFEVGLKKRNFRGH